MPDPTPANLLGFFTAFRTRFFEGYAGTPSWWQTLAMMEPRRFAGVGSGMVLSQVLRCANPVLTSC